MQQVQFMGGSLVLMRDGEQEGDAISMAKKMMALAEKVGRVDKDRTITLRTGGTYSVVSYEAFAAQVRSALREAGLAFFVGTTDSALGGTSLTLSRGFMSFMDTDTGALLSLPWQGQGDDPGDKGANKALTAGVKYALMRSLLVSTDDDSDESDGHQQPAAQRPAPQQATTQQQRDSAPQAERNSDPIPPARRPAPRNQGNAVREPESVRTSLQLRIASQIKAGKWAGSVADSKLVGAVASRMAEVFAGDPDDSIDIEAHQVVKFLFGKTSIKDLTDAEGRAVLGWTARKEGDEWILPDESRKEARNIVASLDAEGQEQLF